MDKKAKNKLLTWFYPGIRVKRYIILSAFGVIMASLALARLVLLASMSLPKDYSGYLTSKLALFIPPVISYILAIVFFVAGLFLVILGVQKTLNHLFGTMTTADLGEMADGLYKRRLLSQGPEIVVIGGGSGLSTLLRGLKNYTSNLTAIVTAADDGGSSGRIRREWGLVPPGDIRNCLLALADTEPLMNALFDYRFKSGQGLEGHNFGNLFILAMSEVTGDFETAVQEFSRVLKVRGQVMASTLNNINLKAIYENGTEVLGESAIASKDEKIYKVELEPANCNPNPLAIKAIEKADIIILGPGSLYTSIMPNLLVPGIVEAIEKSNVPVLYVVNVMTEPGETTDYSASDHLRAILEHTKSQKLVDSVLVNIGDFEQAILERYQKEGAAPVVVDTKQMETIGVKVIAKELANCNDLARHDSGKLAAAVMGVFKNMTFKRSAK